jgi:tetratricopeptide (TPR) repeat protein
MKGAWENYATKDKAKFKPQFNFDEIAGFDRAIYNQINNPLILRLFLEIYNGKALPKKGAKHLNIWHDWLKTFSTEEQLFLKLVANEVWQKGENELLLDDLLKHEILKPYLTSDIINAPYNRLKNNGWISRYVKDLSGCLGFTVEGSLLYLLALQLQDQKPVIDLATLQSLLKTGSKLQKSAIESFLCEQALNGNLNLVADLVDAGDEYINISIKPLLLYLKTFGIELTVKKVLENPSENDWKALNKLDTQLYKLQLHILRKDFLIALIPQNEFKTKDSLELGLGTIAILDKKEAINYLNKLDTKASFILEDAGLLSQFGHCEKQFANYDKALAYYEACLKIRLKTSNTENLLIADSYNNIGKVWFSKGEYDKALENYEKGFAIKSKILGIDHIRLSESYGNIGSLWYKKEDYEKTVYYYEKSLNIRLKNQGEEHSSVATSYNNLGMTWFKRENTDLAMQYLEKALAIRLKTMGDENPLVAHHYNNIGQTWNKKGNYDKAIIYYMKSVQILLKILGSNHPDLARSYNNIGNALVKKGDFEKAIENFANCLAIYLNTLGGDHPSVADLYYNIGEMHETKAEYEKALEHYVLSSQIRFKKLGALHNLTKTSIESAKRLAKELGKENELLDWIKNKEL